MHDPGNRYAADYMWFTTGLAFNVDKARERLGIMPLNSWDILFKPELSKNSPIAASMCSTARRPLHHRTQLSQARSEFEEASPISIAPPNLLAAMRPYVKKFHSSEYINALANGDICLAVGWSGDTYQGWLRARERSQQRRRYRICNSERKVH